MNITFDPAGHRYTIDGVRVPSVTEVLASQNDWSMVPAWQLEAACAVGRDVHAAVNLMVRGALDWDSLDACIAPYVRGAQQYIADSGGTVLAAEQVLGSKGLGVAGTLDLLMLMPDGWHYFIDWKVSAAMPSTVGAQLAAYRRLWEGMYYRGRRMVRSRRVCVRLKPDGYNSQRLDEMHGDWNLFQSCLNAFQHRERGTYA